MVTRQVVMTVVLEVVADGRAVVVILLVLPMS